MSSFKIENKFIGEGYPTFIIAEIGINHNGDFMICKKMIKSAYESGANGVKIQTVDESSSYIEGTKSYDLFKNKDFTDKELLKLRNYSKKLGVIFFSTPGDIKSFKRLLRIKTSILKISSGLSSNYPLIRQILKSKTPLIISTGMSTIKDIKELNQYIKKFRFKKIAIMKCTSQYPAQPENLNLKSINYMKKISQFPIGYSDHAMGDTAVVVAVANGASLIEKHFTLNKKLKGADHFISLEPKEFKEMVRKIRITEKALGEKNFNLNKKIKKNKNIFSRHLTAIKDINVGDRLNLSNIGFMRHKTVNSSLPPNYFFKIENKRSKYFFKKGQLIKK